MASYDTVKNLIRTEKGTMLESQRKYIFAVATGANKVQIRKAVEDIYKVKVQDVNTSVVPGKLKRVRQAQGKTASWKKAVVTLSEGSKIEVT